MRGLVKRRLSKNTSGRHAACKAALNAAGEGDQGDDVCLLQRRRQQLAVLLSTNDERMGVRESCRGIRDEELKEDDIYGAGSGGGC